MKALKRYGYVDLIVDTLYLAHALIMRNLNASRMLLTISTIKNKGHQ